MWWIIGVGLFTFIMSASGGYENIGLIDNQQQKEIQINGKKEL